MCDATPTLREATALAGLAQTLVAWCEQRLDDGTLPDPPREWTVRENRWLAARYGLDARLIVEHPDGGPPVRRPVRELVTELLEQLAPVAEQLGSTEQLSAVADIAAAGSGTARQRAVVAAGGTLHDVVDHLRRELDVDRATQP